jgi:hypothetical protein
MWALLMIGVGGVQGCSIVRECGVGTMSLKVFSSFSSSSSKNSSQVDSLSYESSRAPSSLPMKSLRRGLTPPGDVVFVSFAASENPVFFSSWKASQVLGDSLNNVRK